MTLLHDTAFEEVERRLTRVDRHERARCREMYDWAMRELAGLRDLG